MRKIIALILSVLLAISMLTACEIDQPNETDATIESGKKPTDEPTQGATEPAGSIINIDGSINYNFEYFEATGENYGADSLIGAFPLINDDDEFWSLTQFTVYPADGVVFEGYEDVAEMTWDEVKNVSMENIKWLFTNRGFLPSIEFKNLLHSDSWSDVSQKTVGEVIADIDWYGNGWVTMQKQIDIFFPDGASNIAEMIVKNYGQPSEVEIYSGRCRIEYYIGNRSVTMSIGKNVQQDEDELPYSIQVFVRIHEE